MCYIKSKKKIDIYLRIAAQVSVSLSSSSLFHHRRDKKFFATCIPIHPPMTFSVEKFQTRRRPMPNPMPHLNLPFFPSTRVERTDRRKGRVTFPSPQRLFLCLPFFSKKLLICEEKERESSAAQRRGRVKGRVYTCCPCILVVEQGKHCVKKIQREERKVKECRWQLLCNTFLLDNSRYERGRGNYINHKIPLFLFSLPSFPLTWLCSRAYSQIVKYGTVCCGVVYATVCQLSKYTNTNLVYPLFSLPPPVSFFPPVKKRKRRNKVFDLSGSIRK